ncbi:hypothetical protein KNE206_60010 [Kitasatospora sp. NE20-6]|uniref:hypothetical protein n=1 Tax=Kitasatospora sp. NE20-6 TaxID=2859066 RepID=UPI0034DC469D
MGSAIVYVHGIGNKPPEQQLKEQWDDALFGRPMGGASRMAYWARLLHPEPLPGPVPDDGLGPPPGPPSPLEAAGPGASPPTPEEFLAGLRAEAAGPFESGGPAGAAPAGPFDAWQQDMTYAAEALAAGESPSALEMLPLPRSARTLVFRALVRHAVREVHAYFFGGLRDRIVKIAVHALEEADGPVVVIGHSLGSVVAYEALRAHRCEVPLLVTVGSPLGITEIQDRLAAPLVVPPGVAAWRNACDLRDIVALDSTVRPEYAPADRTEDVLVVNDSANHHGAAEYLRSPAVRDPVRTLLGGG